MLMEYRSLCFFGDVHCCLPVALVVALPSASAVAAHPPAGSLPFFRTWQEGK